MKSRFVLLVLAALLAGGLFHGDGLCAQDGKEKEKDKDKGKAVAKKPRVSDPQEILKLLQERMKALRSASIEFRITCILEFANAPCKETVDYLTRLYSTEKNAGVHMAITQALGMIASEGAIRSVILKGLPLLANNAFNITAVAEALSRSPVGSSASSRVGSVTIARAIAMNVGMMATYDEVKETCTRLMGTGLHTNLASAGAAGFFCDHFCELV